MLWQLSTLSIPFPKDSSTRDLTPPICDGLGLWSPRNVNKLFKKMYTFQNLILHRPLPQLCCRRNSRTTKSNLNKCKTNNCQWEKEERHSDFGLINTLSLHSPNVTRKTRKNLSELGGGVNRIWMSLSPQGLSACKLTYATLQDMRLFWALEAVNLIKRYCCRPR